MLPSILSRRQFTLTLVVACLCLALPGCGNNITQENLNKIKPGMTQQEVEAILGTGTEVKASTPSLSIPGLSMNLKAIRYGDDKKNISVLYQDGKVALPPMGAGLQ